jgi:hypothetical protein
MSQKSSVTQLPQCVPRALTLDKGWNLVEMRPLAASLEDVFIQLVMREDAA